ncbi:collagen alpha-1(I) chain-like [Perognathus longimembris pacificus]|uniref:collagen alpha-1(I) chain-like n=1 Tax=Perognathus longimembris pacificus TaxID=214514 RepID=UPI002018AF43|nr:collagen alpha-1(I) chain-like [Perognathus longimembris pacificus]
MAGRTNHSPSALHGEAHLPPTAPLRSKPRREGAQPAAGSRLYLAPPSSSGVQPSPPIRRVDKAPAGSGSPVLPSDSGSGSRAPLSSVSGVDPAPSTATETTVTGRRRPASPGASVPPSLLAAPAPPRHRPGTAPAAAQLVCSGWAPQMLKRENVKRQRHAFHKRNFVDSVGQLGKLKLSEGRSGTEALRTAMTTTTTTMATGTVFPEGCREKAAEPLGRVRQASGSLAVHTECGPLNKGGKGQPELWRFGLYLLEVGFRRGKGKKGEKSGDGARSGAARRARPERERRAQAAAAKAKAQAAAGAALAAAPAERAERASPRHRRPRPRVLAGPGPPRAPQRPQRPPRPPAARGTRTLRAPGGSGRPAGGGGEGPASARGRGPERPGAAAGGSPLPPGREPGSAAGGAPDAPRIRNSPPDRVVAEEPPGKTPARAPPSPPPPPVPGRPRRPRRNLAGPRSPGPGEGAPPDVGAAPPAPRASPTPAGTGAGPGGQAGEAFPRRPPHGRWPGVCGSPAPTPERAPYRAAPSTRDGGPRRPSPARAQSWRRAEKPQTPPRSLAVDPALAEETLEVPPNQAPRHHGHAQTPSPVPPPHPGVLSARSDGGRGGASLNFGSAPSSAPGTPGSASPGPPPPPPRSLSPSCREDRAPPAPSREPGGSASAGDPPSGSPQPRGRDSSREPRRRGGREGRGRAAASPVPPPGRGGSCLVTARRSRFAFLLGRGLGGLRVRPTLGSAETLGALTQNPQTHAPSERAPAEGEAPAQAGGGGRRGRLGPGSFSVSGGRHPGCGVLGNLLAPFPRRTLRPGEQQGGGGTSRLPRTAGGRETPRPDAATATGSGLQYPSKVKQRKRGRGLPGAPPPARSRAPREGGVGIPPPSPSRVPATRARSPEADVARVRRSRSARRREALRPPLPLARGGSALFSYLLHRGVGMEGRPGEPWRPGCPEPSPPAQAGEASGRRAARGRRCAGSANAEFAAAFRARAGSSPRWASVAASAKWGRGFCSRDRPGPRSRAAGPHCAGAAASEPAGSPGSSAPADPAGRPGERGPRAEPALRPGPSAAVRGTPRLLAGPSARPRLPGRAGGSGRAPGAGLRGRRGLQASGSRRRAAVAEGGGPARCPGSPREGARAAPHRASPARPFRLLRGRLAGARAPSWAAPGGGGALSPLSRLPAPTARAGTHLASGPQPVSFASPPLFWPRAAVHGQGCDALRAGCRSLVAFQPPLQQLCLGSESRGHCPGTAARREAGPDRPQERVDSAGGSGAPGALPVVGHRPREPEGTAGTAPRHPGLRMGTQDHGGRLVSPTPWRGDQGPSRDDAVSGAASCLCRSPVPHPRAATGGPGPAPEEPGGPRGGVRDAVPAPASPSPGPGPLAPACRQSLACQGLARACLPSPRNPGGPAS